MGAFSFGTTKMKGVYLVESFFEEDGRGYFLKDFEKEIFRQNGLSMDVSESFESFSRKNVVRGLHFQTTEPQAKLVRAVTGEIFDVIVDLRTGSDTFGKWEGFSLTGDNRKSLFIPKGFAHGFGVRSDSAIVSYKCVGAYKKGSDSGIIWNDQELAIDWGIDHPVVSERDRSLMTFKDFVRDL